MSLKALLCGLAIVLAAGACTRARAGAGRAVAEAVRVGHFPNITHAHGLVAHASSREQGGGGSEGWFEKRLGVPVEWTVFPTQDRAPEA